MIHSLFFPDKIYDYYLFRKRIIGFDIGRTHITASQILLTGRSSIVEKIITEVIEINNEIEYLENVGNTLKKIIDKLDSYDEIRTAFNSSTVVFKQLRLPFLGRDKIEMTLGFEVEPLLPFPLADTIIDFIITHENLQEKSTEVLVAAVQKQHIAQHLALFEAVNITPDIITVDFFSIYSFYSKSIGYAQPSGSIVLIDMGSHTTTLGYIVHGQLRLVRALAKGSYHCIKNISELLEISPYQAMEMVMRYGLESHDNPSYQNALLQTMTGFWREINFTLQSFAVQAEATSASCTLILFGGGSSLKGLTKFVTKTIGHPCELWNVMLAVHDCNLTLANTVTVSTKTVMSLATALPLAPAQDCSLRKQEFANPYESSLFVKQFFTASALLLLLLCTLITSTIIEVNSLHKEAEASEMEARSELKQVTSDLLHTAAGQELYEEGSLDDLVTELEQRIKNEEKLWFSFANPSRISYLKYLLELTTKIDKKSLGFVLQKLTISDGMMTIDAQVRDHDALKLLEKELRQSKLFITVEGKEDPNFKAMKIKLAQTE